MKHPALTSYTISRWVVASIACISGCSSEPPPQSTGVENGAESVSPIHAVGYLEPKGELRRLAFRGHGVISSIEHPIGTMLQAGEVIARLNDDIERTQLVVAEAKLGMAEAKRNVILAGAHPDAIQAAEDNLKLALAEKDYHLKQDARLRTLNDRGSVSEVDVELAGFNAISSSSRVAVATSMLTQLKSQTRDVDRARANAECVAAEAEVAAAEAQMEARLLRAPFDGRLLEVFLREGEAISISYSEPVALFAPAGPMEVRAEVDESFVGSIKVGGKAKVYVDYRRDGIEGTIHAIKPVMGKKSVFSREPAERLDLQIIEVRIQLTEPPNLPFGYEMDVEIESE